MELSELKKDVLNFNKGTYEGAAMIEHSLKKLKAGRSILIDKDGNIIAGNKTAETAERLGYKLRVIESDGSELIAVKRTDIDINSKDGRELAIADNATAQINLQWDDKALQVAQDEFDIDPADWDVNFDKNAPFLQSQGEVDVEEFDTNQVLKIKLSVKQYELVVKRLKQCGIDLPKSLLLILGWHGTL